MNDSNSTANPNWLRRMGEKVWAIRGLILLCAAVAAGTMAWTKWNERVARIPKNTAEIRKNEQNIERAQNRLDKLNDELEEMNKNIRIALCTQKEGLSKTARVHLKCSEFE